jgi:hypothetical protein
MASVFGEQISFAFLKGKGNGEWIRNDALWAAADDACLSASECGITRDS